ncbi:hypothetical protein HPB50_000071 [Hyalomma asiaticum]|uniref:Uncharacterized protein n=1 Tax=Hyalomma asiaticum TaxID=266040 RepID=A0ACB7T6D0_HYAAI|nr:hypothetical protein HPB50_000071 [Hyalomma asiaticum]
MVLLLLVHEYTFDHEIRQSPAPTTRRTAVIYQSQKPSTPISADNVNTTSVKLLFWTTAHGLWPYPLVNSARGMVLLGGCNTPCFVTRDRSLLKSVNAVVFHDRDADANDLPSYRDEHQRWVYWNMEAPPNSRPGRMARLRSVFNWTYTYRLDSDVPHPYFSFVNKSTQGVPPSRNAQETPSVRTNRSILVAWVASNCRTQSRREDFVAELRKHVPVDVYGRCGDLKCIEYPCQARFGETYYFYLALENCLCREYVTEKFYDALKHGMVPVVLGNYARTLAPPGSYIDALSFRTPQQLASYLKTVAANATLYELYFAWRQRYTLVEKPFHDHCDLCQALHDARPGERKQYSDIVQWWHGNNVPILLARKALHFGISKYVRSLKILQKQPEAVAERTKRSTLSSEGGHRGYRWHT